MKCKKALPPRIRVVHHLDEIRAEELTASVCLLGFDFPAEEAQDPFDTRQGRGDWSAWHQLRSARPLLAAHLDSGV